ncbi:MAG: hypothetical protein E6L09_02500 [Verrucomicrobia bacterium]|nr:MAG: hypothetical protein E6L09_02500 [Verrucomicrobiota bacterium]
MTSPVLFEPPFPTQQIVGLGVLLLLLALIGYFFGAREVRPGKRLLLVLFRTLALAGIIVVLCRPMTVRPRPEPVEKPIFSVLVDSSSSMNTKDEGTQSRIKAVATALKSARSTFLQDLERRYQVNFYEFADELLPGGFEELVSREAAKGSKTDIASALFGAVNSSQGRKHAGILLVSDGRDNAGGDIARAATHLKSLKIPVWTAAVGSQTETKDLYVTARLNQNFSFAKQPAVIKVDLSQTGFKNWYAKVNLYREDKYVTTRQVNLKEGTTSLDFPIKEDHRGVFKYTVAVEPLPGEADAKNNRRSLFVRVVDQKPRVLLVEAEPYWDTRFLLRSLHADPNLEVSSVFQLSRDKAFAIQEKTSDDNLENKSARTDFTMPRTKDELYQYDCLILGRGIDAMLRSEELKLLRDYLTERGGSIVFARGKSYAGDRPEIAGLEPVVWDTQAIKDVRFELTGEGRMNPIFAFDGVRPPDTIIRELPSMVSVTKILKEKSLSVILARSKAGTNAQEMAVISYQRFGKGKVMSIGSAGLWRWAFMPEDFKQYDDVYQLFWRQMVRWLIDESDFLPGQDVSFRTERYSYGLGERIRFLVRAKNVPAGQYQPKIVVRPPEGQPLTLMPASAEQDNERELAYTAFLTPETEGEYEAVLSDNLGQPRQEATRFTVYSDSVETRLVAADRELLAQVARVTGGSEIPLAGLKDLPRRVRQFEESSREKLKAQDIWDRLPVFSLLVGLLAMEWYLRRRLGLV